MKNVVKRGLFGLYFLFAFSDNAEAITLTQIAETAKTADDGVFGSLEYVSNNYGALPQWNRVVTKMKAQMASYQDCLANRSNCHGTNMQSWHDLVKTARQTDKLTQLRMVNSYFNQWKYTPDSQGYGVSEYWASPTEFMNNSGDCEDYAIVKYFTLRFLGYNDSNMRLVSVVDTIKGIGHSVLSVNASGGTYILDNNSDGLYRDAQYKHYVPKYSVNQSGRWTHARATITPASYVARQ